MARDGKTPVKVPVPDGALDPTGPRRALWPSEADVPAWTDHYFRRTRAAVRCFGDARVTYAVFMRRPVISAPRLALDWLQAMAKARGAVIDVDARYREGKWVGAGEPLFYVTGPLSQLADLETLLLMKLGPACVAAYNAYTMCADLPHVAFLAMDARHCAGTEMAALMAYGAAVGSDRARRKVGAVGFVANATDATAHYFGQEGGTGTMPHAFIGYAGSTLRAAEMFDEAFPDEPMTVLVDYFAREVTDALTVCRRFPRRAAKGELSVRPGHAGQPLHRGPRPAGLLRGSGAPRPGGVARLPQRGRTALPGRPGVSAAAVWHMRDALGREGFNRVKIVASSGFGPAKCRLMAEAEAPIDVVGSGSYLPSSWSETYATADIVEYDGVPRVKVGREWLLRK